MGGSAMNKEAGDALDEAIPPWTLVPGASWIDLDGRVHRVPGFHEAWLAEHPDLSKGARNVCELVLASHWISAALFGDGYAEFMVHDRHDADLRERLLRILHGAASRWNRALVIAMNEEGYAMLDPKDAVDVERLGLALDKDV
jgi:hypothetical protein